VGTGYQVTEVQKSLSGFDYPGSAEDLAKYAEQNGADSGLVDALRSLKKDNFDGPSAVMQALGSDDALGGTSS
jgi:uncharacterized protein DUF2795